ncbi:MAG: hypothetical protein KF890_06300 [Nitrospira sp.]|nr:hypothetical protein [Nitrospira sp.]
MKKQKRYAGLSCLCLVAVVSVAVPVSAERLSVGIGAGERHGVHHDWFERNRFLYKVVEAGIPDSGRPDSELPYQLRQDQSSGEGNMGNEDINLPDSGVNRSMTPSTDVPTSVHGGGPNPLPTFPDARPGPESDPSVRDLIGSGLSEPTAPPGSLGR